MPLLWFVRSLERTCTKNGTCEIVFSGPGVERISEEVKKNFHQRKLKFFQVIQ